MLTLLPIFSLYAKLSQKNHESENDKLFLYLYLLDTSTCSYLQYEQSCICSHLPVSSSENPALVFQETNLIWSGGPAAVFWKTSPV